MMRRKSLAALGMLKKSPRWVLAIAIVSIAIVVAMVFLIRACGGSPALPTPTPKSGSVFRPGDVSVYLPNVVANDPVPADTTPVAFQGTPLPTITPRATFTPVPLPTSTPTRQPVPLTTKLGVGVYGMHPGDHEIDSIVTMNASLVLIQDPDMQFVQKLRARLPKAFIIGRLNLPEQPLDNPEQRGIELADRVAEMALPRKGLVDAWMGYNEVVANGDYAAYRAYDKLQVAFAKRLQEVYGVPAVCNNDGPGAVEPTDYAKYFANSLKICAYFGIHAYSSAGAYSFRSNDVSHYALRYRLIHRALEDAGITGVRMVLTEVGYGEGWRGNVSEEWMAEDFAWLASEADKDPYVVGIAIYGMFVSPDWQDFNILYTTIVDLLGQYQPRTR